MARRWRTRTVVAAASFAAALPIGLIALAAWPLLLGGTTFDAPPASPPLAALRVTRRHGKAVEIHATLAPGVRLADVVDVRLFDGFEPGLTVEEAVRRIGPPTGRWHAPPSAAAGAEDWHRSASVDEPAPFYDLALGRVTLRAYRTPEQGVRTIPVGRPAACPLHELFPDRRVGEQLRAVLPDDAPAYLNIHRADGWGGVVLSVDRSGCRDISLGWRDAPAGREGAVR